MKESTEKIKIRIAGNFEEHFLHFGFKKTTVDEVAKEMGMSKKTIYKHFSSKDDIFYFIITRLAKSRRLMIEKKLKGIDSAWDRLETMIGINISEFKKIMKMRQTEIQERFQNEIAAKAFREAFYELLSDIVEEGMRQGEFRVCDKDMTIHYIQALTGETVNLIRDNTNPKADEYLICTLKKILK